ncbi:MAG: restriction endonuclease subunit S, partial [Synergistaceae bacterium]|nr:restriction endonuclease subunit S [Synergistaceae bacterium]
MKWGGFLISDIAEIVSGRGIFEDDRMPGNIPYVGASAMNNGVIHFVSNTNETLEAECISVNSNGSVGYAFYHPYEALYSGDCRKLRPHVNNRHVSLFLATAITDQREKYNYGYKMGTARLMRQQIMLPVDDSGNPDWAFMEAYMREREQAMIERYISHVMGRILGGDVVRLEGVRWAGFRIGDLFRLEHGKCLKSEMVQQDENGDGVTYLGATNRNNAVIGYVNYDDRLIQKGNCIAFIKDGEGSAGYSVYKAEDFIANFHIIAG